MKKLVTTVLLGTIALTSTANAQWGTVKGKFTFDGTAPAQSAIKVTKDVQFCGKQDLKEEELVVNSENGGIANVVIYLYEKRGAKPPKVHPDYKASDNDKVTLDNKGCRFEPHITLLRTSQTLVIGNVDAVPHNASLTLLKNQPQNNIIPANNSIDVSLPKAETLPALVRCDVHPWMSGRLVVKDHPYMAVTDADGNFEIANMPTGKHTLQLWHEKAGYIDEAKVGGKTTSIKRGRLDITVKDGENDLGEFKLGSKVFK
ncbi:MAG: hypothetical protein KDB27_30995 [Planctomycetales bacterium]|nr:hypothetical protein [Planctomycetales bacterium]